MNVLCQNSLASQQFSHKLLLWPVFLSFRLVCFCTIFTSEVMHQEGGHLFSIRTDAHKSISAFFVTLYSPFPFLSSPSSWFCQCSFLLVLFRFALIFSFQIHSVLYFVSVPFFFLEFHMTGVFVLIASSMSLWIARGSVSPFGTGVNEPGVGAHCESSSFSLKYD